MKLALFGTGLMGTAMGLRLIETGHVLDVFNRTPEHTRPLSEAGARSAERPVLALANADCVILMLADATAIREVLLKADTAGLLNGRQVIQMGTIAPQESRDLARAVAAHGARWLEAPVLGSLPEARAGKLQVMVGGETADLDACRSVLEALGQVIHVGAVGQAAALKLALNQLIGGLTASFALSLGFVQREGVSVEDFMSVLRGSALYAPTFDKKLPRMLSGDFANPNFPLRHLLKDLRLFEHAAADAGIDPELLGPLCALLERGIASNRGGDDYSVLYATLTGKGLQ
ncbi:MAG: NAD(P)-dependent oxidoreductase [Chromatiales bacterium]|nr:NAD(P)-dependent oxidoreductase [Chromatiales bacterium]